MSAPLRIAIVGLGLVGTSIGLDLSAKGYAVDGFDTDQRHAEAAKEAGAVWRLPSLPGESYDAVILAAPPTVNQELLLVPWQTQLIMDTSSVKAPIVSVAVAHQLPFVGGHPIAGREGGGPGAAMAGLFAARTFVLCPAGGPLHLALRLVEDLGAQPVVMDGAEHDRVVARSSHLVYLASAALALTLAGRGAECVGPAAFEALRPATSPSELWEDILSQNEVFVQEAVHLFATHLKSLCHPDAASLEGARRKAMSLRSGFAHAG